MSASHAWRLGRCAGPQYVLGWRPRLGRARRCPAQVAQPVGRLGRRGKGVRRVAKWGGREGSTSPESQRTMIGRRDRRGEPREQRAELGAFSTDHEHHPQRREARCRVHLSMPWLPTGTTCRGIQRAAAGRGQVCRAHMLRASLPCPDSRTV